LTSHNKFELIDFEEKHLEKVLNWRNRDEIRKYMYNNKIITPEEHANWYNNTINNNSNIIKLYCIDNIPAGLINFSNIERENNKCNWGFYIAESFAKGTGNVLGYLALDYIFNGEGLRKLCAEVIVSNDRSLNFHKKLGFQEEGLLKKHIYRNDVYTDIVLLAIFNEEWNRNKNEVASKIKGWRL
jgi:UDP-4-amino-4,6-dideoxy-N-acetyl-beta-L-altrosamine N-acetyltransferase